MRPAALVAKVYPLATVSGLLITRAAWQYFSVWLAERCRSVFVRRMLLIYNEETRPTSHNYHYQFPLKLYAHEKQKLLFNLLLKVSCLQTY